jgi:hypothetical protein
VKSQSFGPGALMSAMSPRNVPKRDYRPLSRYLPVSVTVTDCEEPLGVTEVTSLWGLTLSDCAS